MYEVRLFCHDQDLHRILRATQDMVAGEARVISHAAMPARVPHEGNGGWIKTKPTGVKKKYSTQSHFKSGEPTLLTKVEEAIRKAKAVEVTMKDITSMTRDAGGAQSSSYYVMTELVKKGLLTRTAELGNFTVNQP